MVPRDTGLVLPPWHHYNKTGERLTLHMDTENRGPRARAQNNIYRLNRRPMYSSRKLTRTQGGAGGSGAVGARLNPGRILAPRGFGRDGEARQSSSLLPAAAQALTWCRGTHHWHLAATPERGTAGREGQRWHRPVSISFPPTQKTLTKLKEAAWLHMREVSPQPDQVSALMFQCRLRPLPAQTSPTPTTKPSS